MEVGLYGFTMCFVWASLYVIHFSLHMAHKNSITAKQKK